MSDQQAHFYISDVLDRQIAEFCQRWQITKMALFGSALRPDFGPESDVDILVSFAEDAEWSLLDHVQMQQELQELFQRNVDLVTERAVERSANWLRRQKILNTSRVLFSQAESAHAPG